MFADIDVDVDAIAAEVRKTSDTAGRMANGEHPEEADEIRVLAGIVRQLADQVERLATRISMIQVADAPSMRDRRADDSVQSIAHDRDGHVIERSGDAQTEADVVPPEG